MKRAVEYKYDIGESVKIVDIDQRGRVDGLETTNLGERYRVVFWMNGDRNEVWMYDWELESCE